MIDFTNSKEILNIYKGSEKKKTLIYNNKKYLVKFPDPIREKNKNISYINNAFSEYIGSNIFKISGFNTQNTILGIYKYQDKEKIVCACEDFTDNNNLLYEFEALALSFNLNKKIGMELKDILEVIEESKIGVIDIRKKFWDMFVVDSLIGNTDRHNGNWGFIINSNTLELSFAPIYDCGSCLNPLLDDEAILKLDETEIKNLALNTYSCIKINDKKINSLEYIKSMQNEELNQAICRTYNNINLEKINKFIDGIDVISISRKTFYKTLIKTRYEIIKETYNTLVDN